MNSDYTQKESKQYTENAFFMDLFPLGSNASYARRQILHLYFFFHMSFHESIVAVTT